MSVNTDSLKQNCSTEYVVWIDIMGTKNTMSESFQKAANFILKFHSCVVQAVDGAENISYYPLMDGVFITSPNFNSLKSVISIIFSNLADLFLSEDRHDHRFIIKGSLAYGAIAHGLKIDERVCPELVKYPSYKCNLMFGMPMIQAYTVEHFAPPFGLYIHESARNPKDLQGKYFSWANKEKKIQKNILCEKILSYFDWCDYFHEYLELSPDKIAKYKRLTLQYFTNKAQCDKEKNPWDYPKIQ